MNTQECEEPMGNVAPYETTPDERAFLDAFMAERKRRRPAPSVKVEKAKVCALG
jgi:hypothetical protein